MIDFKLNQSGDIILEQKKKLDIFTLSFINSVNPVFKTNFHISGKINKNNFKQNFCLTFTTDNKNEEEKNITTINFDDEIRQRIMIKLRTELDSLFHHKEFGSTINIQRHKIINEQNLGLLETAALEAIQNITQDTYRVSAKQVKRNNHFVTENINLYIYKNEELFFIFEL